MIQVVGAQVGSENIHRSVPRIKEPRNLLKFKGASMAFQPIVLVSTASLPCPLPLTVEKQICACAMAGSFARDMMISQGDRVAPSLTRSGSAKALGYTEAMRILNTENTENTEKWQLFYRRRCGPHWKPLSPMERPC